MSRGFSLLELLLAIVLTTVLAGTAASLVATVLRAGLEHPRAADEQQRLRAAFDQISGWVGVAGQGLRASGLNDGWLPVPPLYPQRRGVPGADADTSALDDRITIVAGVEPVARAQLAASMTTPGAQVAFDPVSCGPGRAGCGFSVGTRVLIADARATGEWFTVTAITGSLLDHAPALLSASYTTGQETTLHAVDVRALVFDPARRQLRVVSPGSDLPLIDGVAGFAVRWLGDPRPPSGPRPAPGQSNCILDEGGGPRLAPFGATVGPWADLSLASLSDGPWCGTAPWRYDADLLRVRLLRFSLQLERTGAPATGVRDSPVVRFDVAPRNLVRLRS